MVGTSAATNSAGWGMSYYASPVDTSTSTHQSILPCISTVSTDMSFDDSRIRGDQHTQDVSSDAWPPFTPPRPAYVVTAGIPMSNPDRTVRNDDDNTKDEQNIFQDLANAITDPYIPPSPVIATP